jgi:hypothetical protein
MAASAAPARAPTRSRRLEVASARVARLLQRAPLLVRLAVPAGPEVELRRSRWRAGRRRCRARRQAAQAPAGSAACAAGLGSARRPPAARRRRRPRRRSCPRQRLDRVEAWRASPPARARDLVAPAHASVATPVRLRALAGPAPVVSLPGTRRGVEAPGGGHEPGRRAGRGGRGGFSTRTRSGLAPVVVRGGLRHSSPPRPRRPAATPWPPGRRAPRRRTSSRSAPLRAVAGRGDRALDQAVLR